jgi:hypothetical protein
MIIVLLGKRSPMFFQARGGDKGWFEAATPVRRVTKGRVALRSPAREVFLRVAKEELMATSNAESSPSSSLGFSRLLLGLAQGRAALLLVKAGETHDWPAGASYCCKSRSGADPPNAKPGATRAIAAGTAGENHGLSQGCTCDGAPG